MGLTLACPTWLSAKSTSSRLTRDVCLSSRNPDRKSDSGNETFILGQPRSSIESYLGETTAPSVSAANCVNQMRLSEPTVIPSGLV